MVNLPKSLWRNCFVAIDEAHEFAPNTKDRDYVSSEPIALMFSKGRKRGFCPIIATQRLSKLSMDVAAEAKNRCIGQTVLDVDQKRAADFLGWNKDRWSDLRDLSAPGREGEFFGIGPAFNERGIVKFRAGQVESTHPEPGQGMNLEPPKPSKTIAAVLAEFKDLPQQAEEEIRELSAAKQKIATLERELKLSQKSTPNAPTPQQLREAAERARRDAQTINQLRRGLEDAMKVIAEINARGFEAAGVDPELVRKAVQSAADQIVAAASKSLSQRQADFERLKRDATKVLGQLQKLLAQENVEVKVNVQHNEPFTVEPSVSSTDATEIPAEDPAGRAGLPKAERAILDALVWLESIGVTEPADGAVAFVAGYSPTSTGYTNPRGQLRQKGLLEYLPNDDARRITADGRALAVKPKEPLSNKELQNRILTKLPKAEQAILKVLIKHYPKVVSNETCAEEAGYSHTSTGYTNPRGRLRTLGLAEYQGGGVVAKSILFPVVNQ
jgi:DNA-binding winged helix-turn-helix (wHTH) protein